MMASAVIGALRVNLGIDTAAFSDGLKKANARLAAFGKVAKGAAIATAAAATAAVGGMAVAVKGSIDAFDAIEEASQKIGIPIEELSRLKYAAEMSGVSFGTLQTGARKLSTLMADSANGISSATEAMTRFGLSATNADGSMKSASQVMAEIADKFAAMPDGVEKTAMAVDLFGRSGTDMILMLNGGSQAINRLMLEAETFGQVVTQEAGQSAAKFNENLDRLRGAFSNISAEIATRALPHLAKFSDWLVANAPAITNFVVGLVDFAVGFAKISASVGWLIADFVRFHEQTSATFHGIGSAIREFVAGAWQAFNNAWEATKTKVNEVVAAIQAFPAQVVAALSELGAQMYQLGVDMIDGLWQGIQAKWSEVKQGIYDIPANIRDSFSNFFQIRSPSRVMMGIGQDVMSGFNIGMESMAGQTENLAQSIGSTIGSAFKGVIDGSKSVKDALIEVGLSILKTIAQMQIARAFGGGGGVGGFVSSLVGGLFGFANGGSFMVGGAGGVDSQLVAFKASPNERVTVTKPGQSAGGGSTVMLNVQNTFDGNTIRTIIRDESGKVVAQAAPGIVQQSVATVADRSRRFPGGR